MIDLLDAVWLLSFQTIQQVFNFDNFIGSYMGLVVVIVSTCYLLAYIITSIVRR